MAIVQRRDTITSTALQEVFFSDFLDNFDIDPTKKDLLRYTNENAVKTSIRNLLMTNKGDRLYKYNLGSDIRSLLFENASPGLESVCADLIKTTISNHEPRAKVLNVLVNSDADSHSMVATIVFSIINREQPITLELILNRIR